MPLYEYACDQCHHRFEVIRKFSDPPLETCPECGGHVRKLLSSPAIQFKGSGWYVTDYAKKKEGPAAAKADAETGGAAGSESKVDSAAKQDAGGKEEKADRSGASTDAKPAAGSGAAPAAAGKAT
jgi:putative FmdB family regulatory protein